MSATRYKLPDWLGGHEVEHRGVDLGGRLVLFLSNGETKEHQPC